VKKCVLIFLFLGFAAAVMGQKKPVKKGLPPPATTVKKTSRVDLIYSTGSEQTKSPDGRNLLKVRKGVFKQDYSTLTSDSAYFYPDQNLVDAFGHVHITQGDTLNIYSDKLHYDGNTKLAVLTDHVIMIDKDATLTTNYLTYNTATRIAIYTTGGKLVNKDNTLTSKTGYYFAQSRDAYFRYNVVCTTPDALIKTDTLKYNTKDRISYFFGPTHIYGTKDKDTLYTENGDYNTITEQARFGKKNLYTQGTKSLKGDSLFYDRLKGYGRAVKRVTFSDSEQKITLKGDLGEYFKTDDRALVTQNAYMIIVTEEKDSTQTDSAGKKLLVSKTDSLSKKKQAQSKADSATIKRLGLTPTAKPATDSATLKRLGLAPAAKINSDSTAVKQTVKDKPAPLPIVHLGPPVKPAGKAKTPVTKSKTPAKAKAITPPKAKDEPVTKPVVSLVPVDDHIKRDSIFLGADTLETQILTYKDYKILQRQRWEASNRDTSIKVIHTVMLTKPPKVLTLIPPKMLEDTGLYHPFFFGKPKPKPVAPKKPLTPAAIKKLKDDSVKNVRIADSLQKVFDHGLTDTSRIRIITAHHHAKLFKSDLQAKADSMFYSYSDSTIRMFVKPMIWTQGSQLSGDTINLQLKNKKFDNMDQFPSAFIAQVEKNDSLHFNQVAGKTMHGTFKDNKLSSMTVRGNAETIYFDRDSVTNKVTNMTHTVSGIAYAYFKNGEVKKGGIKNKAESAANAIAKIKEDDKTLKSFIWKPKDRPKSRQDVMVSYIPPAEKKPATKGGTVKGTMPIKSSTKTASDIKSAKDSAAMAKPDSLKKPPAAPPKFGPPIIYN
jgi:lipopolysaccharide export system protein LptA